MDAVAFTHLAQTVSSMARKAGLDPPVFTSPPHRGLRSMRRRVDGRMVVAVARADRELVDVAADLVDGILAANHRADPELRRQLISELVGRGAPHADWGERR